MATDATKSMLKSLKQSNPILTVRDRQYKRAYSETMWSLVQQVVEENDRLSRQTERLEETLKWVTNQSQLGISEARNIKKALSELTSQIRALPSPSEAEEAEARDETEDTDLKGL